MPKSLKIILIISISIAIAFSASAIYFVFFHNKKETLTQINQPQNINSSKLNINTNLKPESEFIEPIQNFKTNQTKKTFGQFIDPATSPIQPERFQGFHIGVDIEINPDQVNQDIPVYAIADAKVIAIQYVQGYGGVIILETNINNEPATILYGHINLSSVNLQVGDQIKKGQQIAVLGDQYSNETNGERKHLHFAIHKGPNIELRGYVNNQEELQNWYDPNKIIK